MNSEGAESQLQPSEPEPIMADPIHHPQHGPHNIRRSLSGNNVPTKPIIHIAPSGPGSGATFNNEDYSFGSPRKKMHKKSPSMYKDIDSVFSPSGGGPRQAGDKNQRDPVDASTNGGSASNDTMGRPSTAPVAGGIRPHPHVSAPSSTISNVTAFSTMTNGSGSSSGSGSTVRNSSINRRDGDGGASAASKARNRQRKMSVRQPNALNFLDSDSPDPILEGLRQSIETDAHAHAHAHAHGHDSSPLSPQSTSPSKRSAASSATSSGSFRDDESDLVVEDGETERSTSPETSIINGGGGGEGKDFTRTPVAATRIDMTRRGRQRSYRPSPPSDIPLYPSGLNQQQQQQPPYMSPNATTPRALNQGPFTFPVPPPPRPERMPLTGYELIASRFCAASAAATSPADHIYPNNNGQQQTPPPLKPIYRRFEALHHRLLLHLQDEICELEEQLHRLDSADMQSRQRLQGCIPASRRAEQHSGNEMHWHRLDILGNIAFKLERYNNILSSFRKTQFFSIPSLADINDYRHFLATSMPIVESETHFLDATDDLICVNAEEEEEESDDEDEADSSDGEDAPATPMVPNLQFNLRGGGTQQPGPGPSPTPSSPSPFRPPPPYPQSENHPEHQQQYQQVDKNSSEDWRNTPAPNQHHQPTPQPPLLLSLPLAITGAILLPVLAFAAIPGFVGRLAVVFVVLVGVVGALLHQNQQQQRQQSEFGGGGGGDLGLCLSTRDVCVCAGCYGAVMAVLAGVMG